MTYHFENASILVVDDVMPMASLIASLLRLFNFKAVYVATGPEQALALFIRHNPDIVLTDWQMEPHDGLELVRRIRTDPKSPNRFVPVILITGYSQRSRVKQARDIGVTEFLVKPFRAGDLYARIEQIIEKPRQFVETRKFFGPDRRRKFFKGSTVPERREVDGPGRAATMDERDAAALLKTLWHEVRGSTGYDKTAPIHPEDFTA